MPRDDSTSGPPCVDDSKDRSPTLPLPPPIDRESLEDYLISLASLATVHHKNLHDEVNRLRESPIAVHLLHEALLEPCTDVGRHLLLLSVISTIHDQSSIEPLERFVWISDANTSDARLSLNSVPTDADNFVALYARAAEIFVQTVGASCDAAVIRIVQDHPMLAVRLAAIDTWLHQQSDTQEAMDTLIEKVRPEDAWAVGLARHSAHRASAIPRRT